MMGTPWENYPQVWKTKAAFMSFLRGGIRRALWNRSPIKIEFLKKYRQRIPNPSPRGNTPTVWGACCSLCRGLFPLKNIEVDHRVGQHSLKDLCDLQPFIEGIVCVSEGDLQLICKPCHKIKSMAEKQGISFEQAQAEKEAIALIKAKKDLTWLRERGIVAASNQAARRKQIVQHLMEGL